MQIRVKKFSEKAYRQGYVSVHLRRGIARQIQIIREQRGWTQQDLAEKANKTQNTVSRWEDPSYGKFTINTLIELGSALDVALVVKFVPFSQYFDELDHQSPDEISAKSFVEEFETKHQETKDKQDLVRLLTKLQLTGKDVDSLLANQE